MIRLFTLLSFTFLVGNVFAGIPLAQDLKSEYNSTGLSTGGQEKVVLMLVSQPNCTYCVQITEEIIRPMIISGRYNSTTLFSELEINTGRKIKDFTGQQVDASDFARRYDAWATPTLLFLDKNGNQLANKMVGINTVELYGYYVDKALRDSFNQLNP